MQKVIDETSSKTPESWSETASYPDVSCEMALPMEVQELVDKSHPRCPSTPTEFSSTEICKSVVTNPDFECFPARKM
jgi:hypothetical protein